MEYYARAMSLSARLENDVRDMLKDAFTRLRTIRVSLIY
jgi:hypothetical protein